MSDPITNKEANEMAQRLIAYYAEELATTEDQGAAKTRAIGRLGNEINAEAQRQLSEAEWDVIFDAELNILRVNNPDRS